MTDVEKKKVWAVQRFSDQEGWVIEHLCEIEATARVLARPLDANGYSGIVIFLDVEKHGNAWWGPVRIVAPTDEDKAAQEIIDKRDSAEQRAREAGLTEEDIACLRLEPLTGYNE